MNSATIVQKLWNCCNVLRDDGMSYGDYVEQLVKKKKGAYSPNLRDEEFGELATSSSMSSGKTKESGSAHSV